MVIQGRHEGSTCKQVRIINGRLEAHDGPESGSRVLRIEDDDNPAFWIDIHLDYMDIVRLLATNDPVRTETEQS